MALHSQKAGPHQKHPACGNARLSNCTQTPRSLADYRHNDQSPPTPQHTARGPYPTPSPTLISFVSTSSARNGRLTLTASVATTNRNTSVYCCRGDHQSAASTTENRARFPVPLDTPTIQHRPLSSKRGRGETEVVLGVGGNTMWGNRISSHPFSPPNVFRLLFPLY